MRRFLRTLGALLALASPSFAQSTISGPLSNTVADGANVSQGATTDSAWGGSGAGTLVGLDKALYGLGAAPMPCRAATNPPSSTADGQPGPTECDPTGAITETVAPSGLRLSGTASTTGGSAVTVLQLSAVTYKIYLTGIQCFRTDAGTSMAYITINDTASSVFPLPPITAGGGFIVGNLRSPLVVTAAVSSKTTAQFTVSTSLTTVYCNMQGYQGP